MSDMIEEAKQLRASSTCGMSEKVGKKVAYLFVRMNELFR